MKNKSKRRLMKSREAEDQEKISKVEIISVDVEKHTSVIQLYILTLSKNTKANSLKVLQDWIQKDQTKEEDQEGLGYSNI